MNCHYKKPIILIISARRPGISQMLQKIFQALLRRYCGEFLTGIENSQLAFWAGKISFHSISLKHQKINQILKSSNIPFSIKYSHIGSLQIDVPWKSLSSTPVQIKVFDVYIVLKMEKVQSVTKKIQEEKLALIKGYVEYLLKKMLEGDKGGAEGDGGYIKKMGVKIIHNLNAEIRNISIRICQGDTGKSIDMQQQRGSNQSFMSVKSNSQVVPTIQRRASQTNSQRLRRQQKSFAFGFCIEQFLVTTVDENFNKTFYNLDNKKAAVRKIINMKQISAYMQEESILNIFKVSQEKKLQFMKSVILREKYRLLSIDGKLVMNRNIEKERFYDYMLEMGLNMLQIKSTYGQMKQIVKILANFGAASETKQIKKLSQVEQSLQQQMKQQFVDQFPSLRKNNFEMPSNISPTFSQLLQQVSKKNLLSWTKQLTIEYIKQTKIQTLKKQKNKKGWLGYLISQAEVDLTQQQITQVYQQIQQMIKSIQDQKKMSIKVQLILSKIIFLVLHEGMQGDLSLQFEGTNVQYVSVGSQQTLASLTIQNIYLTYRNEKENFTTALLTRGISQFTQQIVQFSYKKSSNSQKINLLVSQLLINHQMRVLLFISQLLKLKTKQDMKSDIKLKKLQLSQQKRKHSQISSNNNSSSVNKTENDLTLDIQVNKIVIKAEVNSNSHIQIGLDLIKIGTHESNAGKIHVGILKNFNIDFVIANKKAVEKQHINSIIKDFCIDFHISSKLDLISTKVDMLSINICQTDLHNIYRSFSKQALVFKSQKVQQKNKQVHENSYLKSQLSLLTIMKSWKTYEALLTDEGLYFYEEQFILSEDQKSVESNLKPVHFLPLNNSKVTIISDQQFKIQSDTVNELIGCPSSELEKWVQYIDRIVFQSNLRAKMFYILEQGHEKQKDKAHEQKKQIKFQIEIKILISHTNVLISENKGQNLMKLSVAGTQVRLLESQLQFQRIISINQIKIQKLDNKDKTEQNTLLSTSSCQKAQPLKIQIEGKKKLHPEYHGQISISAQISEIKVNYDPEFMYRMIKKIAWGHQMPSYTNQMRNQKVLDFVTEYLRSANYERRQHELNKKDIPMLQDYYKYLDIEKYKNLGYTCLVLLSFNLKVSKLQLNLINGLNHLNIFNAKASQLNANLSKGSQFIFFHLTAQNLSLDDTTGYPNTNIQPYKHCQPIPIIVRKAMQPDSKQIKKQNNAVQCRFSRFDLDRFINKQRIKSFFMLQMNDMKLYFQNQIINRFFDYLFNNIVGFVLAPNSLHRFDGPRRGPFLYQYGQTMTQKQIKEYIGDSMQPFFTKMFINADNLTVQFNSFPQLQGFDIDIDTLKIESFNCQKSERISFNLTQLPRIQRSQKYKNLLKFPSFQQKILKNHWVSRMRITAQSIRSQIFLHQINKIDTYLQRLINGQKQIIFPFIKLDNSMICQSNVKNMSVKASKQIYNLINKCMMHNVSYDDSRDNWYVFGSQFRNLSKPGQIFYKFKADQLQIVIPEMKTAIAIPDFEYKFIRHPSMIKQMTVQGRTLNIFKNNQIIIMSNQHKQRHNKQMLGLYYRIQLKLNGEKPMQVKLSYVDIVYNLPFFMEFISYTILDQSCYPPLPAGTIVSQLPDLPLISCWVHLENSRIKLIVPDSENQDQFICSGKISLLWVRNILPHPEKYVNNMQNFPNGKQWCSYRIIVKDLQIRKHYQTKLLKQENRNTMSHNQNSSQQMLSKDRYRLISNKISLVLKISQIMKIAPNRDRYNDSVYDLEISQFRAKLCYVDIEDFKKVFTGGQKKQQPKQEKFMMQQSQSQIPLARQESSSSQPAPPPPPQPPNPYSHTKYNLDLNLIQIQLGLSQIPVPLIDIILKSTKSSIDIRGQHLNGQINTTVISNCWNMLIGRWQPILEDFSPTVSFKLGNQKYLLCDCSRMLLFNVSLQALKIFKLIMQDFSQKGKFQIAQIMNGQSTQSKIKGINVSPYVLTNLTGLTILIRNELTDTKIKLKTQQKTYIDLKNYEMDFTQKLKICVEFESNSSVFQINMDIANCKKISVTYKNRTYELLLRPISNSIMKEIIISSLYVIENRTSYALAFYYNCGVSQDEKQVYEGRMKILSKQRTALKFTANIRNTSQKSAQKLLKLQFPQLQKQQIQNNCQFPFQALINDYQHCIDLVNNRVFNCILSLNREEQRQTTIIVQPSFYVKNLLPVEMRIQFVVERESDKGVKRDQLVGGYDLGVGEQKDIYDFGSKEKIKVRVKIRGFNISAFQQISIKVNNEQHYKTHLDLIDYRGHAGKIAISILKENRLRRMYIFSEAVLINQTSYDWYIFSGSKLIPGQKIQNAQQSQSLYTFIPASEYQTLTFGFSEENPFNSNQIKISELGIHNLEMYKNQLLYEFTVKCTFHCLDPEALIYSYVLKAQPKFILVNQASFVIQIKQEGVDREDKSQVIRHGYRCNWVWPDRTQSKKIQIRAIYNQQQGSQWLYSSPIQITDQDIQQTVLTLRPLKHPYTDKLLLKLTPIKQNQSTYLTIQQVKKSEDELVTLVNQLQHCKLRVYQLCIDDKNPQWINNKHFQVSPKAQVPFGWDYVEGNQELGVEICFIGYLRTKFDTQVVKINLEKQKTEQIIIQNEDGESQMITIKIEIIGLKKKISFYETEANEEEDTEMMHSGNRFAFSFTQIGLSVISSVKKRSQLLYISFKKVEIIMMEKKTSRSFQVKVKYINIDNNYNHNTIYPILFTPLRHDKTLNKSRPFFVLLLEQTLGSKDIVEIREFRVCTEPISIKIHDEVLTAVMDMTQQMNKQTDKSQGKVDLMSIFRALKGKMQWQQSKLMKPQRDIFFRQFQVAKLQLQLTFSIRPKLNTNNFIIMTILSSFGAAISNVSEAQLTLSRFLKRDKGFSQLKTQLSDFYLMQIMKGIYKVLGSINLFGNPYVFIRMLAEGAWEIVNQPTEGFIKGPIEGAIGIAKGGIFFTRNVVAGTCNSFEAISQSISRGVSYLTMDQKFIERRQKIKNQKSSHIFKGLQYGAFSFYTGIQVAITGLVRHPAQGYANNGVLGGVTGTLKGFSGLITKPISGTFQGISKVSQGIKNTVLMFQDGPNSRRMRPPRVFFSQLHFYKNYNIIESTSIQILQFHSTKYLNQQINYISILYKRNNKDIESYVLTSKYFTHVDIISRKIISEIEINNVQNFRIENNKLQIMLEREIFVIEGDQCMEMFQVFNKYCGENH